MHSTKSKLVGGAYEQLKAEILSNRMPPGFQAPEPEIALRLGMSRTPVREALIRLEGDGLVELIPRHGARVLPVSAADMAEIYEILTALEPAAAAALARQNLDADVLAPLEDACNQMEQAVVDKDLDAWALADDHFHTTILSLHGNRRLQSVVSDLLDQSHRARMVTLRMRSFPERSTREHRAILEKIRAGDADGVHALFRAHRERAAKELLGLLDSYKLPGL